MTTNAEGLPAPGRGSVPSVSAHSGMLPMLYHLEEQPLENVTPLIARQYVNGVRSTFCKWTMKKGATVTLHHHAYEQVTHEFVFTEDTIDIDVFSPQRQDWIDGTTDSNRYV